mmetsp:Transcript_130730/g.406507  ORF Transcript_130730/g.406507 Transcript_130730/m.406507 type:complete len:646 (-) Transcript_130730:134-2071(-)
MVQRTGRRRQAHVVRHLHIRTSLLRRAMDFDDLEDAEEDVGGVTYGAEDWKEEAEKKKKEEEAHAAKKREEDRKAVELRLEKSRKERMGGGAGAVKLVPLTLDVSGISESDVVTGPPLPELKKIVDAAAPVDQAFPLPDGSMFGPKGKEQMKMLFLHGGGTNAKISKMQTSATFKDVPDKATIMDWSIFEGIHKVPCGWNGDFSLGPFGPDFFVYFERWPYANCQWESWDGIDDSFAKLKKHFKENGPYDGVCGFDEGGELLVHAARKAQEGDPDFAGQFRFMILFTSGSTKHLSTLGKKGERPGAQLRLPTLLSWCTEDPAHPFMWYEETCLFVHRDFREVVRHTDGHLPGKFVKGSSQLDRLVRFLDAMRTPGAVFTPSKSEENEQLHNIFLPMKRTPKPVLPSGVKCLLVVHDPMGPHDFPMRLADLEARQKAGEQLSSEGKKWVQGGTPLDPIGSMKLKMQVCTLSPADFEKAAGSALKVEGLTYTANQAAYNWHCAWGEVPSPTLSPEDLIIDESHEATVTSWAEAFTDALQAGADQHVGIVGLGTGAFVALAIAKSLIRRRGQVPAGLWVVNPPARLPWSSTKLPGMLSSCPVRMLTNEHSISGPGWRYEVSTCGPFSQDVYKSAEGLVQMVVEEMKDA